MRVQVGDVRLFFDIEGARLVPEGSRMVERPTLLLLHGSPSLGDHSSFKPAFSALADVAQVVYMDHRGAGRSDRSTPDRWNLDTWADDVRRFCDSLEIEHPIVLGNSFGGVVALAYALRHPEHPAKLILSSTWPRMGLRRTLDAFERAGGLAARAAAEAFLDGDPTEATFAEYRRVCVPLYTRVSRTEARARAQPNPDVTFHWLRGEARTFDMTPQLGNIRCPTLVLAGECDPMVTIADVEDMVAALPADVVRFERFADAGHGVFRDEPTAAIRIVREFITA